MSYHDRKWASGWGSKAQLPFMQAMDNRPTHRVNIDAYGVYNERKRLKSKWRGVAWHQSRNKAGEWQTGRWQVTVRINGERHFGGSFSESNELAAAEARDRLVLKLGANLPLNFPPAVSDD